MHRRKHSVAVLTVIALIAGATGCSIGGAGSGSGDGPAKVGFVHANSELRFSLEMAEGFTTGVGQVAGVEDEIVAPPIVDGPAQLALFTKLRGEAVDGLSVFTLAPEIFAEPMAKAEADGVKPTFEA